MPDHSGLTRFFKSAAASGALADLARLPRLTLFVGAGVSMEAGLPSWPRLIETLLRMAADASDPFRQHRSDLVRRGVSPAEINDIILEESFNYARWIISTHGLLGAAAVVKAWLEPHEYLPKVQEALYKPITEAKLPLEPGQAALEIARLWQRLGQDKLTVVTTNYDLLLEQALEAAGVAPSAIQSVSEPPVETKVAGFTVVHLHGIVPEPSVSSATTQPIVLAEDEYLQAADDEPARTRRAYCEHLLKEDPCLFLGTSLTDPNLLTYLYGSRAARNRDGPRHFALMANQGDQPPGLEATPTVLSAGRRAAAQRLSKIHIEALQLDFFSQTPQFLAELRLRLTRPESASFIDRLAVWTDQATSAGILPSNHAAFRARQPRVRLALELAVRGITGVLAAKPSLKCEGEHLALHLWVHDAATDGLIFVARSDQEFFSPATLEHQPIAMPTGRLVVESVCSGYVLEASGHHLRSSRWKSMLVVPLALRDDHTLAGRDTSPAIPVGAIVLASDMDAARGLSRFRDAPSQRASLIQTLAVAGEALLDPSRTG